MRRSNGFKHQQPPNMSLSYCFFGRKSPNLLFSSFHSTLNPTPDAAITPYTHQRQMLYIDSMTRVRSILRNLQFPILPRAGESPQTPANAFGNGKSVTYIW